jgi:hypothetical protein
MRAHYPNYFVNLLRDHSAFGPARGDLLSKGKADPVNADRRRWRSCVTQERISRNGGGSIDLTMCRRSRPAEDDLG